MYLPISRRSEPKPTVAFGDTLKLLYKPKTKNPLSKNGENAQPPLSRTLDRFRLTSCECLSTYRAARILRDPDSG